MSEAIVTDKTLTIEDAPADAKATGDAINNLRGAVGSPLVAATAASMTDTNKVYVYTGSETGYTNGNWYYHNGTSWVSGGVYNSVAVDLDSTLTLANKAPDSKVVGDAIGSLNEDITNLDITKRTEETDADLYICDSQGNVIAEFSDGHIFTKNFSSAETKTLASSNSTKIGTLSDLTTDAQDDLVSAINEIDLQTEASADSVADIVSAIEVSGGTVQYEDNNGNSNSDLVYTQYKDINANTGEIMDSQYSSANACETYFPIPSGAVIFNYLSNQGITSTTIRYYFYDAEKVYLGSSTKFVVDSSNVHADTRDNLLGTYITIPQDAAYYRLTHNGNRFFSNVIYSQQEVSIVSIPKLVATAENIKPLKDLKILAFGDSVWGNDRTDGIADFLAEYSGATVYNGAIGGTRITGDRDAYSAPAYKPFDGVNLVQALIDNDWTDQDASVSDVTAYVASQTLPMLKALDMSTIDVVILNYGNNDFTAPKTIAQTQQAFETVVSALQTAYPSIRIMIQTPQWRMFTNSTVDGDTYENSNGDTLREFCDGIIEKAKVLHVSYLDMMTEAPINIRTKAYYLDNDYVHPNTAGNELLAHIIYGKLRSMY